jgi:hypothetical protein
MPSIVPELFSVMPSSVLRARVRNRSTSGGGEAVPDRAAVFDQRDGERREIARAFPAFRHRASNERPQVGVVADHLLRRGKSDKQGLVVRRLGDLQAALHE